MPEIRSEVTVVSTAIAPSGDNQIPKVQFSSNSNNTQLLTGDSEVRLPHVSASNFAPVYSLGARQDDNENKTTTRALLLPTTQKVHQGPQILQCLFQVDRKIQARR